MPSFQSFKEFPHQKLFFDLKDKNYKKAKMKGGLGWMKNIWKDPRSLFNGNHFSSHLGLDFHNIIGERAKRARRYLVMFMETRDIYIYIYVRLFLIHMCA